MEVSARPNTNPVHEADTARTVLGDALTPAEWSRLEQSVDRALAWMATQQRPDGSFPSAAAGQPAVTSLCVIAFLSRGHQPGVGPHGATLNRAIDFVLKCQRPDGLLNVTHVESSHVHMGGSHTATYNHAIAGLMLTEVFGCGRTDRLDAIREAIEKALQRTLRMQSEPAKRYSGDAGGWRYLRNDGFTAYSDLSVTAWHLMFLRSAKNAEFHVPDEAVTSAMDYVERCYAGHGQFYYGLIGGERHVTRSMTAAGVLSLSLGGQHQTSMAREAGDWLLANPPTRYGITLGRNDRYHYGAYYSSQAMAQLGGDHWRAFFPPLMRTLLQNQASNGSWPPEQGEDTMFGSSYSTAMAVLTLTPPFQLLPIYQR